MEEERDERKMKGESVELSNEGGERFKYGYKYDTLWIPKYDT